jgi:hypothetical protein
MVASIQQPFEVSPDRLLQFKERRRLRTRRVLAQIRIEINQAVKDRPRHPDLVIHSGHIAKIKKISFRDARVNDIEKL